MTTVNIREIRDRSAKATKPVGIRDLGAIDRIHNSATFASGIADAVRGLTVLQGTECEGVLALLDVHVEILRELATDLEARS